MTEIDALLAREACRTLVARMARGIDRMDEALLRGLFWPDATDDHGLFAGPAQQFVDWVLGVLAGFRSTSHNITTSLIELSDEGTRAIGESWFIAQHSLVGAQGAVEMFAAGRYLDTFEKRGREWRFLSRKAVYDWTMTVPASGQWDEEPMLSLLARGGRGEADPSFGRRP